MTRELDAKVALQVGYHLFEEMRGEFRLHVFHKTAEPWKRSRDWRVHQGRYRELSLDEIDMGSLVSETLFHYSTDIATAFPLFERLEPDEHMAYIEALCAACGVDKTFLMYDSVPHWLRRDSWWALIHATAEERCHAFLAAKEGK